MAKFLCLPTVTAPCRLRVIHSTPGGTVHWPLMVVDPCPYSVDPWCPDKAHAHVHALCDHWPGNRWLRLAPCNRAPYLLHIEAA